MKKIILAGLLCLAPMKAFAQASMLNGAGAFKCSKYNDANDGLKSVFFTWVQGYMAGVNTMTSGQNFYINMNSPDFDYVAQQGLLTSFCLKNPNDLIAYQGLKILTQMSKMGLKVNSKP